jgi:hypothetical protein
MGTLSFPVLFAKHRFTACLSSKRHCSELCDATGLFTRRVLHSTERDATSRHRRGPRQRHGQRDVRALCVQGGLRSAG